MLIGQSLRSVFYTLTALLFAFCVSMSVVCAQDSPKDTTATAPAGDTTAVAVAGGLSTDATILAQGKELFDGNCKQCHAVHEQNVGPALKDVTKRQTVPWLINFIKAPQKVIESGDPYAKALYEKFKAAGYMPNHNFKDAEISAILSYIQDESGKAPVAATPAATGDNQATAAKSSVSSGFLMGTIAVLGALLLIVLLAMAVLTRVLVKYLRQKDKNLSEDDQESLTEPIFDLGAFVRTPGFIGLATLLFLGITFKAVITGLFTIGVQQGYAPTQPIPFSHKLHAGFHKIDCKYCHTGANRGKSAGIPSANICMNCHNTIRNTSPLIQKIYAAIENDEPIQWVRVHNLPDLSYFNHAQHVNAGKVECQTCHGQVQEMEVVEQASLLTMGWCIACHRKTEVQSKDNGYYEKFVKIHSSKTKAPVRVEDIGGLECGKCHY